MVCQHGGFKIDWFKVAVAAAIGLYCLCAPRASAQPAESKTNAANAVPDGSGPIPIAQLPAFEGWMTEMEIKPEAVRMYRKAVRELHDGKAWSAEKDARRAVKLDTKFADADALAATAALAQRQFDRARAEARDAVRIDANDEKAWVILATADNYLGRYADAADALGHVREQDRATWQVAYQWSRAEAGQEHAAQALEWANRAALTAPPGFAPLHILRASVLLAAGKYGHAADELEIYLQSPSAPASKRTALTKELHRLRKMPHVSPANMGHPDSMDLDASAAD